MTAIERPWREVAPVRGAFSGVDVEDDAVWSHRLRSDRERAKRNQADDLFAVTEAVEARSRVLGADAVILSGSTARARRTQVSDLDYHVIGARPSVAGLPGDIDLYTDTPDTFEEKLRAGDDFAHWSVWYGCVLFDSGVLRAGAITIAREGLWPDPVRKLDQARTTLEFADKLVASGDDSAALEQVRAALSLVARWWLLEHDVFPLARDELSEQLSELEKPELAADLHSCVHGRPPTAKLRSMIKRARGLTEPHAVQVPVD
jgi:hypothetical protein